MKQTITFRLDDDLVVWLDNRARETRIPRSGVLVQLILKAKKEMADGEGREAATEAEKEAARSPGEG